MAVGCSESHDGFNTYPVSGTVTVDGQPAFGAKVVLIGTEDKFNEKGSPIPTATVEDDGTFRLTSFEVGDGAPDGDYRVIIIWEDEAPEGADPEGFEPTDKLGGKYDHANSELMVTIPAEATELPAFDL